ncbi:MAG TPA: hypothetical protein VKP60_20075 [Magnetospirillaceae bacterium]|nr:hypothetical protein [Magnetospirillaceae bacterium]
MKSRRMAAAALIASLFGSAGAVAQTGAPTGTSPDSTEQTGYSFKCGPTPSAQDWAAELDAIQPVNPVFGGTLIVSLPPAPPEGNRRAACMQAMYEARVEAIRRTELFDEVKISHDGASGARPTLPARTFGLWVENSGMVAGYADAMRQSVMTPQPLDQWAAQAMPAMLKAARKASDPAVAGIAATTIGGTPYFGFKGREYASYADIRSAFAAGEASYAGGIHPAKQPVGKKLLVVIPPESFLVARVTEAYTAGGLDPSGSFAKVAGSSAYFTRLGQAQALKKSGLFREIAVEEKEVSEAPAGAYDAILWVKGTEAEWTLSVGGHAPVAFVPPAGTDPEQMVLAVTDALAKAQAKDPM